MRVAPLFLAVRAAMRPALVAPLFSSAVRINKDIVYVGKYQK